jgi:serine kinase of HPr protein (carbohydrate metabolism regulator)
LIRHAGLIAQWAHGRWRGALIEGPSGSGKSDLALRAMERGFRLVADDRTLLWLSAGRLFGRAPDALRDLIEVRGLDVLSAPALALAEVALLVRSGVPERLPDPQNADIFGVALPVVEMDFREPSAPAKLGRALASFDERRNRRI